jgi:excisionase family DNA binding protein
METRNRDRRPTELLHHDHYTPEELAEVLDISVRTIEQAAFSGRLKAEIVDHHVVRISRGAAIAWLEWRESNQS